MTRLPTGTLSLLFSDIEGSTALLTRTGPAYASILEMHRQILRAAWRTHHGIELGTEGDSFFVVFKTAADAAGAAMQAQREMRTHEWPSGETVQVRIGVHTGAPARHDEGYVGLDVHRAARIAAAAHGGQILVSGATAELLAGSSPTNFSLMNLGTHRLKDLPTHEHLFQLADAEGEREFPPPRSLGRASTLPQYGGPLVGRHAERQHVLSILGDQDVRLVTITGAGGVGKTRLAVTCAETLEPEFKDGVFFVALGQAREPDDLWQAIGAAVGVPTEQRTPPSILDHVPRDALLVLDNLEQFDPAAGIGLLLSHCEDVRVLATSRRPLHLPIERVCPLRPLEVGDEAHGGSASSVRLFVHHATRARPDFRPTAADLTDITVICRRLDGLPLAIEIAAARIAILEPAQLRARLDRALDMTASTADAPERQRSVRAAVRWSYELLDVDSRRVFRRLGVMRGAADIEAVEAVAFASEEGSAPDPVEVLVRLVELHLVDVTTPAFSEPRFSLLETVHAFAQDELAAEDEVDEVGRLHARHYLTRVDQLTQESAAVDPFQLRMQHDLEWDNIRVALDYLLPAQEGGNAEDGLRLCAAEIRLRMVAGLPCVPALHPWLERALARTSDESAATAVCIQVHAVSCRLRGEFAAASAAAASSVSLFRQVGDRAGLGRALLTWASVTWESGDSASARTFLGEAGAIARALGDDWLALHALADRALIDSVEGDHAQAVELFQELIGLAHALGDESTGLVAMQNLACSLLELDRADEALVVLRSLVPGMLKYNDPESLASLAEDYASVMARIGNARAAARLLGAGEEARRRSGIPRRPWQESVVAHWLAEAQASLSAGEWEKRYEEGTVTVIDEVLLGMASQTSA